MEARFSLIRFGNRLWTRIKAQEIRKELAAKLEVLNVGDILVIDAAKVEVFDFSFANELFGKTLFSIRSELKGRFVVVENLNDYTRENLDQALKALNLVMINREGSELTLIGKAHPVDEETFSAIVNRRGRATASALTQDLKVTPTAMNERLSKLVNLGIARREKTTSSAGREQFEYRVLA